MPVPAIAVVGAGVVAVGEVAKLGNNLLQLYFQAAALAKKTEEEIDAEFKTAKTEYMSLPLPQDIPDPA